MRSLYDFDDHEFILDVLENARTDLKDDAVLDEHEFYRQKVAFYLVHMLTWCKQLHLSTELLTNFDYSKRIQASRADHLVFSIENYLIRLHSIYDRTLQLVNCVFHLCIADEHTSHAVIISNYKIQHRPPVVAKIKQLKKYLDSFAQERHTLLHRHSLTSDERLRRIEYLYMRDLEALGRPTEWVKSIKAFRANYLREYVVEKKTEFVAINTKLAEHLDALFTMLHVEYKSQRAEFQKRGL
jgi:hypothetical protein